MLHFFLKQIDYVLAVLGLCCCSGFSSVVVSGGGGPLQVWCLRGGGPSSGGRSCGDWLVVFPLVVAAPVVTDWCCSLRWQPLLWWLLVLFPPVAASPVVTDWCCSLRWQPLLWWLTGGGPSCGDWLVLFLPVAAPPVVTDWCCSLRWQPLLWWLTGGVPSNGVPSCGDWLVAAAPVVAPLVAEHRLEGAPASVAEAGGPSSWRLPGSRAQTQ